MSLLKSGCLFSLCRSRLAVAGGTRAAHWNKDWKPEKVAVTEEEKARAAKKYGLLREEYESYPDDGYGIGDYPKLPLTSVESRDPTYPWDFPEYRRNWGEAMHHDANYYGEDRLDVCMKPRFTLPYMALCFLAAMGGSFLLYFLTEDMCFLPAAPRQLPKPGVTHYKYPSH